MRSLVTASLLNTFHAQRSKAAIALMLLAVESAMLVAPALIAKQVVDGAVELHSMQIVINWSVLLVLVTLAIAVVSYICQYCFALIAEESVLRIRMQAIEAAARPNREVIIGDSAVIIERIQRDILSWREFLALSFPQAIRAAISFFVTLFTLRYLDTSLLYVGILSAIPYVFLVVVLKKSLRRASKHEMEARAETSMGIDELFSEAPHQTLLTVNFNDGVLGRLRNCLRTLLIASLGLQKTAISLKVSLEFVAGIGVAGAYFVASCHAINGGVTAGTIVAATALFTRIMSPINSISNFFTISATAKLSLERLNAIIDGAQESNLQGPEEYLDSVSFPPLAVKYKSQKLPLKFPSISIRRNVPCQIVGPSGSGKTTLMRALCGILPEDCLVETNQIDKLQEFPITYVPSRPWLINGSMLDNLTLFNSNATRAEVNSIVEACCLRHVLNRRLDTKDSDISLSSQLSTGELQRLSIARVLLTKPKILFLDEATGNLDAQNEATLLKNVARLPFLEFFVFTSHKTQLVDADLVRIDGCDD